MADLYTPAYQPTGEEIAVLSTSKGTIRVQLHGKDAPIHVGNFVELAQQGFYDNLKFHRYVENFVIQGGDPNTRELDTDYTVFGDTLEGLDVIHNLRAGDVIEHIEIENAAE